MKINQDVLSIPPYISTSWRNISALHLEGSDLIVTLQNGVTISIPNQRPEVLEEIFTVHALHIEEQEVKSKETKKPDRRKSKSEKGFFDFNFAIGPEIGGIGGINSIAEHNQEHANAPDLPAELLEKIAQITGALGLDPNQSDNMPKAEPHCNCFYCQIARALRGEKRDEDSAKDDDMVSDDDLKFKEWEIEDKGENLYIVSNPLDKCEHYQVYLGTPIGCTCGKSSCEHVQAVLKS